MFYKLTADFHFVVRMNDEFRHSVCIDETFTIIIKIHLKTLLWKVYQVSIIDHQTLCSL